MDSQVRSSDVGPKHAKSWNGSTEACITMYHRVSSEIIKYHYVSSLSLILVCVNTRNPHMSDPSIPFHRGASTGGVSFPESKRRKAIRAKMAWGPLRPRGGGGTPGASPERCGRIWTPKKQSGDPWGWVPCSQIQFFSAKRFTRTCVDSDVFNGF